MLVLNSCQLPVAFSAAFLLLFNKRRKEVTMKHSQLGRSMIEMLGVLAIIAVLSVGGIAGFSKAMEKYKTTKLMNEYSELVRNLLEYRPNFENILNTKGSINLNREMFDIGALPSNWSVPFSNNVYISDSRENFLTIQWVCSTPDSCSYVISVFIGQNKVSYKEKTSYKKLCTSFFLDIIQPLHQTLIAGRGAWAFGGNAKPYYGDAYCDGKKKLCLRDMTLSDIKSTCDSCDVAGLCILSLDF